MSSESKKYDWKEWYWEQAKKPPTPFKMRLLWGDTKYGFNEKALALVAKTLLDKPRHHDVDWTNVRQMHLYLGKDKLQDRTIKSMLSNIRRLQSKKMMPGTNCWFFEHTGWQKKPSSLKEHSVTEEEQFQEIVATVCEGLPPENQIGMKCAFYLAYYLGLKSSQVGGLRVQDFYATDGKVYLFKAGRLIELPEHIRLLVTAQIRSKASSKVNNPPLFRIENKRALARYPKLHETYVGLKRMRG